MLRLELIIGFDTNIDSKLRTHLTKQDSKELRVGKERVSYFFENDHVEDNDNNHVDISMIFIGEGGGVGRGRGVRLPMCWDFTKPLQRTL